MRVREPVVAGRFYPASARQCREDIEKLTKCTGVGKGIAGVLYGGLVPHAGWSYSGDVAAGVVASLAKSQAKVVVIFGGVHRARGRQAAIFADGRWDTPIGSAVVDSRLADRILSQTSLVVDDPYAHETEHSIEVQIPLIQHFFPGASIVPIMVHPVSEAAEVGQAVGRTLKAYNYDAVILGTTDLTHYGPSYNFIPHGAGAAGVEWAKAKNDTRFIELACAMKSDEVVAEANEHRNACSSGAVAATIAAVRKMGGTKGTLLAHTSSAETAMREGSSDSADSVGYAGIVFS